MGGICPGGTCRGGGGGMCPRGYICPGVGVRGVHVRGGGGLSCHRDGREHMDCSNETGDGYAPV